MPPDTLDLWQYRLSASQRSGAVPVGKFWLEHEAGLKCVRVTDAAGLPVGVLLGYPIDLAASKVLEGSWQAPATLGADINGFARQVLWALGGYYLWIFANDTVARIYPDCSAQVPCVWDDAAQMAASSAHAMLDDAEYEARFNHALYKHLGVEGEGWFPAGLTAHKGIERLLPSFFLDLNDWSQKRYWPDAAIPQTDDPSAVVDEMVTLIRSQMKAVIDSPKRLGLALTAGHETRLLLACARPMLADIEMITVVGEDRHTTDTVTARRIVRDFGLRHIELPRKSATEEQRQRFIRRGAHCNADTNSTFHPSVWPVADTHVFMGGLGGEVGRAFFWRSGDRPDTKITADQLLGRFGLPATPEISERLQHWLDELPPMDTYGMLDQAYLEHRNGPWYAVQFCADPTLNRQAPIFTMRGVELMLSLPPDWKRSSRLGHEIILRLWPELLKYPFNTLGPWRDVVVKFQRVAQNPRLVIKKLRKMLR
ncbi:MAG: hypothetical protein WBC90_00205 [Albidovulum sp.]